VDLSPWRDRPLDAAMLAEATTAIVDGLTRLLEQIRGERAPAERWDPRRHDQPPTGDWRRGSREESR
jgi:hypothetical protein